MKRTDWPPMNLICLIALFSMVCLNACGSSSDDDLTPPEVALNALSPSTFEREKTLSGTIETGADIEVSVDSSAEVGEVSIENGIWSCTVSELEPGTNTVTVNAGDERGNTSILYFSLTYDIVRIDQVSTITAESTPSVYGTLIPGGSIVSIELDGEEIEVPVVYDGIHWRFAIPESAALEDGSHTVTIEAEDTAINPQTQEISLTIVREETAVSLTVDRPLTPRDDTTLTLTGSRGLGAEVDVTVSPAATVGTVSYPTTDSWMVQLSDLEERDSLITVTTSLVGAVVSSAWTRVSVYTTPQIVATLPPAGTSDVLPDTVVMAIFSEAMVGTTINEDTFWVEDESGNRVTGTVSYDAEDQSATFEPASSMTSGGIYTANVSSAVTDPDGNSVAPYTWKFTVY